MTLTIDRNHTVTLDADQVSNLVTDLSEFSSLINSTLRRCNEDPSEEQVQALLKQLNLLAVVYS